MLHPRTVSLTLALLFTLGACAGDAAPLARDGGPSSELIAASGSPGRTPLSATTPGADGTSAATSEPLIVPRRFSKKRAMRHIRYLAGEIGERVRATRGETLAIWYAAEKLRAFGYDVTIQKFSVDGRTSRNAVASWPGSKKYPVVIGGHIDSVPGAPGANDNASGSAVILELARIFAKTDQARFAKFVLFGSEEYGEDGTHHVGSEVYVRRLGAEGRDRLAGMVSVDMIADGRPLLVGNSGIADDRVADALYRQVQKRGVDVRRITLCDCSDHGPFEHAGISAAFAYSGTTDYYHSAEDTLDKVKPEDVQRTGQALKAFVKAFDAPDMRYLRRR